jgi:MFS transporter, DHA1 family, purine base/nucleoside efflux pump
MVLIPLLAMILFIAGTVMMMLGPILVPSAADLHTSVAIAGQLATVTSLVWDFTAFGVGPLSDTYGRRLVLLTGPLLMSLGLAGSALVNSYTSLFTARILTGFAGAMIVPTCYVACADFVSPTYRGRGVAWFLAAGSLGMATPLCQCDVRHLEPSN